jgi:hypothetical protein
MLTLNMSKLKRYTSFEAMKSDHKAGETDLHKDSYSEFVAFLKKLQTEYFNKKQAKTNHGRQLS